MTVNRRKLLRGLNYHVQDLLKQEDTKTADILLEIMTQISKGKYSERWTDGIIPSLLLIFSGIVLAMLLIGILLQV